MRVFVSAPYAYAPVVRDVHARLSAMGVATTSSWATLATGPEALDQMPIERVRAIAAQNDLDLYGSNLLIALPAHREGGEMFAEIERARRNEIPIVWVGIRKTLSSYRKGVECVPTIEDALRVVREKL